MQAEAQQQEIEETTSVELEDTSTEEVVEDSKEVELQEDETTRTNVQMMMMNLINIVRTFKKE